MDFKYRNITITGKLGVGKSTLRQKLTEKLAPLGWRALNIGDLQREYQRRHGISELESACGWSDERDREMEAMTKKILTTESKWIYEGWLAGFVAKDIAGVLKVLVVCSDFAVRVDRVVNRDRITVFEAKKWIRKRESENLEKWQKLYGKHDFWDPKIFDLIIDTARYSREETLKLVLEKLNSD